MAWPRRNFRGVGLVGTGAKFIAKPTVVDGLRFASKREAHRYGELKALESAGQIRQLVIQPCWRLHAKYRKGAPLSGLVGRYIADFMYWRPDGTVVVEDVKAPPSRTPIYRWKVKHLQAQYGIEVIEVI